MSGFEEYLAVVIVVEILVGVGFGTAIHAGSHPKPKPDPRTASNDPKNPTITDGGDPYSAQGLSAFNPGRDCNNNCKPCPPNQYWAHPSNAPDS